MKSKASQSEIIEKPLGKFYRILNKDATLQHDHNFTLQTREQSESELQTT